MRAATESLVSRYPADVQTTANNGHSWDTSPSSKKATFEIHKIEIKIEKKVEAAKKNLKYFDAHAMYIWF